MMKKLFWLCTFAITIIACNTADDITLEAGESFTNTNTKVFSIDTMTVEFSSFKFDSIPFPIGDRLLLGSYSDPVFGKTYSSSYLEFTPETYDVDDEGVFDSIVLVMGYDNYFYNDTLTQMTYNVHEVTERIKPKNNEDYFYNTSTLNYDDTTIFGSHTFTPKPMSSDSIRITLDATFGQELFSEIQDGNITDINLFRDFFNGITIQPVFNDDGSILGFSSDSDNTYVRLYYSVPEDVSNDVQSIDLILNTTDTPETYFNHIESDKTGTNFENFEDEEETYLSNTTENHFYMQGGIGIGNTIRIPHMKSLFELGDSGTVLNAYLKVYVNQENYSDNRNLSDSLSVYIINRHQELSQHLYDYAGEEVNALLTSKTEFSETYYTINIVTFADNILASTIDDDLSLCLLPIDYETCVDRAIFNDSDTNEFNAELVITYALYNDE
ncbi:hypothetical protein NBRC110019_01330 [Neptunitalea chrysea]|uniref:DUF4270 family protein n=1 Tax=Neptunitalea chrysea TaxID=1647581 RepID=A0A9W6ETI3_9FLAO|nr:DUF4270 family protein [Neptunitalea chrysea]GLB51094.1 hypothetical protein NBRC110019_01330 [Neptunitalea chrysea]